MTQCKDLQYSRYTIEEYRSAVEPQIDRIEKSSDFDDVLSARAEIVKADSRMSTMAALANARYTLNTRDEFYVKEVEYYDEVTPYQQQLMSRYSQALLNGKFKKEIAEHLSPALIKSMENLAKSTDEKIIGDLQQEAKIVMEYSQLMSTMQFEYGNEKLPLSVVKGHLNDSDRSVRKEAALSIGKGLSQHREKLDDIFDRLVKVRDTMAKKLGFKNFIELGYLRMDRKDYDAADVKKFRANVLKFLVPEITRLKKQLQQDLGIETFTFYDNSVTLKGGEPKPALNKKEMFEAAQKMYDDMDAEIGDFMRFMIESGAFDVDARDGKWGGGYCTQFYDYTQPFILANFNGSCDDVDVLTHEFGHAFAAINCMKDGVYELDVGGMETAECHSMTMELLSHPYMDKFFGKNCDKYRYRHLFKCIDFIPYGVVVDEFQHVVYEKPNMTPEQRNAAFKEISQKYMPYMTYDGIPYLEEGTRWQFQMHIYESPFYYIDYCLAQTVALEFFALAQKDSDAAKKAYLDFVKKGGKQMFKTLVADASLVSPFDSGALKTVAETTTDELNRLKSKIH